MCVLNASVMSDSVTPWTIACHGRLSMGFSRQEYCSGLSFPPPGDLPNPGIRPRSPVASALQADSLPLSHLGSLRRQTKCELQASLSTSFASAGVYTHTHTHTAGNPHNNPEE